MEETNDERLIVKPKKNLSAINAFEFIKRYSKVPKYSDSKYQELPNPNLSSSYLKVSSVSKKQSYLSTQNISYLPTLDIVARGKRLAKKLWLNSSEYKKERKPLAKPSSGNFKYLVYNGNNSELIKTILKKRNNWEEGNYNESNTANFIWHPNSKQIRYDRLLPYLPPQIANHFEYNNELTNKQNLYSNLLKHCKEKSYSITDIMPRTFIIEFDSTHFHAQVMMFICCFKWLKRKGRNNIWIFKPSGLNRGQEIHVFQSINAFRSLLENANKKKSEIKSLIIQKYIESPLLINDRKFDMRMWVLITHDYKCYLCKDGYIRTSSEIFSLNENSLNNEFIHLTNNAIQQKSSSYGKFEEGNQRSLKQLEEYFSNNEDKYSKVMARIKELINYSLLSVKKKINPNKRQHCFEIFGYDFIIDNKFQVWLIECNTNPCLELSSKLLAKIIPRMIHHAFKLTIDKIFIDKDNPINLEKNVWEYILSL